MFRPRVQASRWAHAGLLAALGLSAGGCPAEDANRGDRSGRADASRKDPGRSPGAGAMPVDGLRLSLPPGWTATPEGEEALVIGRGGRRIARLSRSNAKSLPTGGELRESLERALATPDSGAEAVRVEALPVDEDDAHQVDGEAVAWLGRVETPDAGPSYVGLCAKRVGEVGVVLLGTLPGASEVDARAALGVCISLRWGPASR